MPDSQTTAIIIKALSDCKAKDRLATRAILKHFINQLRGQSFENFCFVQENRGGHNLGSMACQAGDGWFDRDFNTFRMLILNGYNPNIASGDGRVPTFTALENDRLYMDDTDFKWAFDHKLNPLAFYPDTSNGQSLLSIDFVQDRVPRVAHFLTEEFTTRLLNLEGSDRVNTLAMLRDTALPCYDGMLAQIEAVVLHQATPDTSTRELSGRRL